MSYVKRVVKGKSGRSRFRTYIAKYKLEWYHSGNYKGFHIGVKFLAPASSSEFFIPVYCVEDTMVRPHTFIITASQGERTLFGTIFLCTALSYQVSEREQILINSKWKKAFWLKTQAKQLMLDQDFHPLKLFRHSLTFLSSSIFDILQACTI